MKETKGKLRYDLVGVYAHEGLVRALMLGAEKYGAFDWVNISNKEANAMYISAAERHINAFAKSQAPGSVVSYLDSESGVHHLAHAIANLHILLEKHLAHVDGRMLPEPELATKLPPPAFKEIGTNPESSIPPPNSEILAKLSTLPKNYSDE